MMPQNNSVIILAAGKGTRMNSDLPKVLHRINGKPLLQYVLDTAQQISALRTFYVVDGYQAGKVKRQFKDQQNLTFVEQKEQLGTGHAVMQATPLIQTTASCVLVLCGDTPLLRVDSLQALIEKRNETNSAVTVLTAELKNPGHYGRILRGKKKEVLGIKEYRDCNDQEQEIKEINAGVYCFQANALIYALKHLNPNNNQGEFYLTDTLAILKANGQKITAYQTPYPEEIIGINTLEELEKVTHLLHAK